MSTVSATFYTNELTSVSTVARVAGEPQGTTLQYLYMGDPKISVRARSPIHHGSTVLRITGRPASRLHGWYWTDRDSKGELDFKKRVKSKAEDYDQAEGLLK
jgi:hypothetical protein